MRLYPAAQPAPATFGEWLARRHLDPWLLAPLLLLCGLGLLVLYSSTGGDRDAVISQAERLALGLAVMVACAQAPPDFYRVAAPWLYGLGLLLLALVLLIGAASKGAQRWLDLGVMRFQPSELMKLAVPMTVAAFLHLRGLPPRLSTLGLALILVALPTALVARQPDLGTALLIAIAGAFVLYFGGLSWRWMLAAATLVAAAAPLAWYHLHDYQRSRVLSFLNPENDPLGTGYHILQSTIAIGSGGLFGKGWLNGTQAHLDFLPESHTDFIFAVYGEEMGLLGACALLLIYLLIVARGLVIGLRAQDSFQRLTAGSLALTFFFYAFVNIGMVIGLLPVVGVPLPLVSYGGTSMVSLLAGFGVLMSIQTHRKLVSS